MADIYLKLDGVTGESKNDKYDKQIELLNFSYSCYQPVNEQRDGSIANATGRCHHGTINCSKYVDSATTDILSKMWTGTTLKQGILTVVANQGKSGEPLEVVKITLDNVIIANYSLHGGGGGSSVGGEEISLSFSKIHVDYKTLSADGKAPGVKVAEWDLATHKGK